MYLAMMPNGFLGKSLRVIVYEQDCKKMVFRLIWVLTIEGRVFKGSEQQSVFQKHNDFR